MPSVGKRHALKCSAINRIDELIVDEETERKSALALEPGEQVSSQHPRSKHPSHEGVARIDGNPHTLRSSW